MKIALGADSVGKSLLDVIAAHLRKRPDVTVADFSKPGFYADVAAKVGQALFAGEYERGDPFCGTGIGMSFPPTSAGDPRRLDPRRLFGRASGEIQQRADHHHGRARHRPGIGEGVVDAWLASEFDPAGPSAANVEAVTGSTPANAQADQPARIEVRVRKGPTMPKPVGLPKLAGRGRPPR